MSPQRPSPANDPLLGQVIGGRFQIEKRIGEGGMGVVYLAKQVPIDRLVAIKVLSPHLARDAGWVQRFQNEAKAVSSLGHPNTVRLFDFGQTPEGMLFMAMEFLDGKSLRDVIAEGMMPPARVLRTLIQMCASLAEAHGLGIIHRDIKPDNVFLLQLAGASDFVKVLDFSVAKLLQQGVANPAMQTRAGIVFGTPQYMSPEQGRGLPLDARSDIYAMGCLGFEMLMGRVPYNAPQPLDVLAMHVRTAVPPINAPESVQHIIRRALEKEPGHRFQSAGEMSDECGRALAELEQGAMPPRASTQQPWAAPPQPRASSQQPWVAPAPGQPRAAPSAATVAPIDYGPPPMPGGPMTVALGGPPAMPAPLPIRPAPSGASAPISRLTGAVPAQPTDAGTVLLESSQGVVSFARQGGSPIPAAGKRPQPRMNARQPEGSFLYWAVWVVAGVAVGLLTYLAITRLL